MDTLISVELDSSQSTVSGDILILLADRLFQVVYLNLARLLRQSFCGHFDSLMGVERIEESDG